MEVTAGYKQTELGLIPEDWDIALIDHLSVKVGSGITPKGGERVYKNEGRPFIRSQNVGWGTLLLDDVAFIDDAIHSTFPETEIMQGDIFLNISGASIGRSSVADGRVKGGNVNQHVCIIRVNEKKLNPKFLNYVILSALGQRQIDSFQAGGNRQGLNFAQVRSIRLPIPSLGEQELIETTLTDIDALLGSLDRLIAKKRDLKQAVLRQLLTGQIRLPGFSAEWSRTELKQLVSTPITDGPHLTPKFYDTGVPFLSVNNLVDNRINLSELRYISKEDDELFAKKCKPKKYDVLLGKAASVGKVAIVESDFDFNIWSPIALVRPGDKLDPKFFYYQLLSTDCIDQIRLLTNSSSQGNIGMVDIEKILVTYPDIEEQTAIAEILSDLDDELVNLETRRDKTVSLKQGMMQELLTGKTRLI